MSLWILRLTVKNFGQSTANSWSISIVITRTFFLWLTFFYDWSLKFVNFFRPTANFFGRNFFNSDSRKLSFSREWSNYREKIDTILCRTKKRPWPSMKIVNIFSGVCTEEYWEKNDLSNTKESSRNFGII